MTSCQNGYGLKVRQETAQQSNPCEYLGGEKNSSDFDFANTGGRQAQATSGTCNRHKPDYCLSMSNIMWVSSTKKPSAKWTKNCPVDGSCTKADECTKYTSVIFARSHQSSQRGQFGQSNPCSDARLMQDKVHSHRQTLE